jgi:streptomycin 6-kinase
VTSTRTPIHPGLDWLRDSDRGAAWLDLLPDVVERCRDRWSLSLGEPYPYAFASLALPVHLPDGAPAVLKIPYPDRESEHEVDALRAWDGGGAVRLLDHDPVSHALLLERCEPGTPLKDARPDEALDVLIGLLPRLWKAAGPPFRSLAEESAHWLAGLEPSWERAGRPFERRLLDAAIEALTSLPNDERAPVLLHQDLHADNVLRAAREPWLVIDPKPLAGEREFSVAPIVRGDELGAGPEATLRRLHRLTSELGLDLERARAWTVAQTVAWAFDGPETARRHGEVVRWLLQA